MLWMWLAGAVLAIALLLEPAAPQPPAEGGGLRQFTTAELGPQWTYAQEFQMNTPTLTAIDLRPVGTGGPPRGFVVLTLIDTTDRRRAGQVRQARVPVAELLRSSTYHFAFPAVTGAAGHQYRLELSASDSHSGVALRADRPSDWQLGGMSVNGRARWANLVLRVYPRLPTVLAAQWHRRGTATRVSGRVVLLMFAAVWVALGGLLVGAVLAMS